MIRGPILDGTFSLDRWGALRRAAGSLARFSKRLQYFFRSLATPRRLPFQRTLAARHLQDGHLVLYDITSRLLWKEPIPRADLVTFGYNRDGKRGHEQMVIAYCAAPLRMKEIIFVGDRGMITKAVADKIRGPKVARTLSWPVTMQAKAREPLTARPPRSMRCKFYAALILGALNGRPAKEELLGPDFHQGSGIAR